MSKQFSPLKAMVYSFFSKALYRDVAKSWEGSGALYLLIVLLIVWIPQTYFSSDMHQKAVGEAMSMSANKLPRITVREGVATSSKPGVTILQSADKGRKIVIDTAHETPQEENDGASLYIAKKAMYFRLSTMFNFSKFSYPAESNFVISPEELKKSMAGTGETFGGLAYPVMVIFAFVYRLLQGLLYAFVGWVFAFLVGASLGYVALYRLVMVSFTPLIVFSTVVETVGWSLRIPHYPIVCIVISAVSIALAVLAANSKR